MADRVSADDLEVAVMWLEANEGEEHGEAESCRRVAGWLRAEIARRQTAAAAREVGRRVGRRVTPAEFRAATRRGSAP